MKQNSKKRTRSIIFALCGIMIGAFLAYGIMYKFPRVFNETVTKIEKDVIVTDEGIADAVEKVYNSVVVITNYKNDIAYASGSGFVYKIDGEKTYLITNYHVIKGGNKFEVTFTDAEVLEAELVGGDEYSDIAILVSKTKDNIKAVETGKTDNLRVGDTTFTVGAPLDNIYSWSVTRGIISGKERYVEVNLGSKYGNDYIMNVLQTDAAVNSGNSGGPLCNSNGDVIGVINAKIKSNGVEGMGFAIPIEIAIEKAEQIINGKESEYPYMGAIMINVSDARSIPELSTYLEGLDITSGVVIYSVEKNSGADNAKLMKGDIITKINGKDIHNMAYLRYELYKNKVGDTIEVTYIRDKVEANIMVKLTAKNSI